MRLLGLLASAWVLASCAGRVADDRRSDAIALPPEVSRQFVGRGLPAFASSSCPGKLPGNANDGDLTTKWRSCAIPTESNPVWLAYDVSRIPSDQRKRLLAAWFNRTSNYDMTARDPGLPLNLPRRYALEAHASASSTPPDSGWTRLEEVNDNALHSRQTLVDLGAYRWFRIVMSSGRGSPNEYEIELELELHDARIAQTDDWIFHGDSNTVSAMLPYPIYQDCTGCPSRVGPFAELLTALDGRVVLQESAGIIGQTAVEAAERLPAWLRLFPGRYVVLALGSNDAAPTRACDANCTARFRAAYESMIAEVTSMGRTAVVPTIPPVRVPQLFNDNIDVLNAELARLLASHPEVVRGPDLHAFFAGHTEMFGPDNVHLTGAGTVAYRMLWVETALTLRR